MTNSLTEPELRALEELDADGLLTDTDLRNGGGRAARGRLGDRARIWTIPKRTPKRCG